MPLPVHAQYGYIPDRPLHGLRNGHQHLDLRASSISPARPSFQPAYYYNNGTWPDSPQATSTPTSVPTEHDTQRTMAPRHDAEIRQEQNDHTRQAIAYGESDKKLVLQQSSDVVRRISGLEEEIESWTTSPRSPTKIDITVKEKELEAARDQQNHLVNWWRKKNYEIEEWYAELTVPTPGYWEDQPELASLPMER